MTDPVRNQAALGAAELAEKPVEYFDTLDLAYRAVDALGGTGASDAYNSALDAALAAIEALGGMDKWERKRKGYPNAGA